MEKLELKHIAPYLPYGLKAQCINLGILEITSISKLNKDYPVWCESSLDYSKKDFNYDLLAKSSACGLGFKLNEIKPILRPMSDIINPCLDNWGVPILKLANAHSPNVYWQLKTDYSFGLYGCFNDAEDSEYFQFDSNTNCFGCYSNFGDLPVYNQLELFIKLFEWHFDVFGLIEKGFAIDINTLNK